MIAHDDARARLGSFSAPLLSLLESYFGDDAGIAASAAARRLQERALHAPLREFLARPGKEIRGNLVRVGWACGGGAGPCAAELPMIIELLHAGSLVVDDIEDDSCERRGAPSMHAVHGLPIALNAANWVYFFSLTLLSRLSLSPARELALYRRIHHTLLLCHEGQALDLTARVADLEIEDVRPLVETKSHLKTSALVVLALALGAVPAGADELTIGVLSRLGRELGCALQMLDDASGLSSPRHREKMREDLRAGKATWPFVWAAERLDRAAWLELRGQASAVAAGRADAATLEARLGAIVEDDPTAKPRACIERALEAAARWLEDSAIARIRVDVVAKMDGGYV